SELAHAAVYAVGADQHVGLGQCAILEARHYALPPLLDADETMTRVRALRGQRGGEEGRQIAAMEVIVGRAELRLDLRAEGGALERAPVVPAPLVHGGRAHAHRV